MPHSLKAAPPWPHQRAENQQQVEDDLGDAYENVLSRVNPLAGCNFEYEVGKEQQSQKEKCVFEGSVDGLIWICHLDERNAKRCRIETGNCAALSFGAHSACDEGHGPFRSETIAGHGSSDRQEASIKSRTWPIALNREMSRLAIGKHRDPLSAGKSQGGRYLELGVWLRETFYSCAEECELNVLALVPADRDGGCVFRWN
jgi:hypothetical protein